MAKLPKINLAALMEWGPQVIALIPNIKKVFSKNTTGPEKKAIAEDALFKVSGLAEGASGKDLVNDPVLKGLISESVELGYQAMKIRERLEEIARMIKDAKGTGLPKDVTDPTT